MFSYINGQHQSYASRGNTYKLNKYDIDLTSENKNNDSVSIKPGVLISKPFKESFR